MSDGLTSLLSYGVQSLVIIKNMVGWRREEKKNHLEMTGNASDCKCFTEKRLFPTSKHLFGSHSCFHSLLLTSVMLGSDPSNHWERGKNTSPSRDTHTHTPSERLRVFSWANVCFLTMGGNWSQRTQKDLNLNPEPFYEGNAALLLSFIHKR